MKNKKIKLVDIFPFIKKLKGRDRIRAIIRDFYDNTCQKCGIKWKKGRKLDVHHLSCDSKDTKKYDKIWSVNTVTLLCHKCHLNLPEHREKMKLVMRKKMWG